MKKKQEYSGIRQDYQKWIKKEFGETYTEWMRRPAAFRENAYFHKYGKKASK